MQITAVLALVTGAIKVIEGGMAWLEARRINSEMTPEQEAEYDAAVDARMALPHWKKSK